MYIASRFIGRFLWSYSWAVCRAYGLGYVTASVYNRDAKLYLPLLKTALRCNGEPNHYI